MTTLIPKYDQGSTGAVNRPISSKLAESVSVLDFGADPTGATDSTSAIQAAINASNSVFFPTGNYLIASYLTVPSYKTLYSNMGLTETSTTAVDGGVKLVFSGTAESCFLGATSEAQNKFINFSGLTIITTGTYSWLFEFKAPLGFVFENINANNYTASGGGFNAVPITGQISWINKFINCNIGLPVTSTSYIFTHSFSDSWFNSCYFSGGFGFYDYSYGGNLYVNNHFDNTNYSANAAALKISRNPGATTSSNKQTSVVNCYFDNNAVAIQLDATITAVNNLAFLTTITGCIFRNLATGSGGIADIQFNGSASFTTLGSVVSGCAMSGSLPSFAFLNANWLQVTFAGNTNVNYAWNLENAQQLIVFDRTANFTAGVVKAYDLSDTYRSQSNVAGIFGGDGGSVLLGSYTGTVPYIAAGLNGSGAPTNLGIFTNNIKRLQVNTTGSLNFVPQSAPSSPSAGDVYYDSGTNKLNCWNGTSWNALF
jgi:hypothetical protein